MGKSLFSVPIFFIVFRETLEAAIIISVLLGLVEQIVSDDHASFNRPTSYSDTLDTEKSRDDSSSSDNAVAATTTTTTAPTTIPLKTLIKKLRLQIFLGSLVGLFIALAIGAAFIAVWFTEASDLWSKSEELWEGIFELVAALLIFVMGITMLKLDRAKAKWRIKLMRAFDKGRQDRDKSGRTGRWFLFLLPLITVLREGIEAVVFVGGVSLGQSATAIPIAAIVGLICGIVCGYLIYAFASRSTITIFLIVMTNFILLIGAGLFSKAINAFLKNRFNHLLGADLDDVQGAGDGPGSYDVRGVVWHLDCCNPENNFDGQGWGIFNALFGWDNNATVGSILAYVFYWLCAILVLIYLKFSEGRTTLFGYESAAAKRRRARVARKAEAEAESGSPVGEKDPAVGQAGHGEEVVEELRA